MRQYNVQEGMKLKLEERGRSFSRSLEQENNGNENNKEMRNVK